MSRPETQLREYFDAGVERITVEDVIAQARVSEGGVRPLHMTRSSKPAWAAAGAFVTTLVGLGALASVLKFAPRIVGDAGAGEAGAEIVEVGGSTATTWLIAAVVAAAVAGLTVWLVHRSSKRAENEEQVESDQGKVTVMETIERAETGAMQKTEQRSPWPIVLIVVMAIALVGLIAWMTLAMRPNSPTAAPPEIQQLIEDYTAAFNNYDAEALEGLVTNDYRLHSSLMDYDLEGVQGYLFELGTLASVSWTVTNDGSYYAVEGAPGTWYVSSEGAMINREGENHSQNGLWHVVDARAGGPLVVEHYFMGG
jgi:flagellar basal body-associated protein FliL